MSIELLKKQIEEAEMVLIGIGEEFECNQYLNNNEKYVQIKAKLEEQNTKWVIPFLDQFFLNKYNDLQLALGNLKVLLEHKNFYIVSTCMHQSEEKAELPKSRLVTPCGGFLSMQCSACDCIFKTPDEYLVECGDYFENCMEIHDFSLKAPSPISCPQCGEKAVFNNLFVEEYNEQGYLAEWGNYTKWLQGTLNKRVCIIELGVSFKYPTVIRFPFEKAAFFNQKAHLIRVHHSLYQITEELKERSSFIKENAIDLLKYV